MTGVSPGSCNLFPLAFYKAFTRFLRLSQEAGSCKMFCCLVEGASSPRAQCTSCKHDEMEVVIPTNLDDVKCITWRLGSLEKNAKLLVQNAELQFN